MILVNVFEIIGTIAFAISGTLIGIEKKMDIFGVFFLSFTTAIGGGIIRDLIIGNVPPVAFVNPMYCAISIATSLCTFVFYEKIIKLKNIIMILDAIGLGIFTAIGSNTAFMHSLNKPFIVVSMGLATGIGGGLLRDVFAGDIPFVFRKEIYAVASIFGSLGLYFTYNLMPHILSMYVCFIITFIIRIISVMKKINLPVFSIKEGTLSR